MNQGEEERGEWNTKKHVIELTPANMLTLDYIIHIILLV